MNSSPMIFRLRSGSSTPASLARNRSSASTWTRGMPNPSNASTTCSASFSRIRPWSTKTQVSLSPTARWTSSAATEESTPPESPQITLPSPTWALICLTCSAITDCGDHCSSHPAISRRNRVRISVP
jgi:hypothetical protein